MTNNLTREHAELRAFIIGFLSDPAHDNKSARSMTSKVFRIALAAMDSKPVVDSDFIPKNLDRALAVLGMAIPESREEFNFQTERWIQRLIDSVVRYADEFQEQPAPVPDKPIAWLNDAYLARGVVDGEAGSEDAGPGYIPVYREAAAQTAPVVPEEMEIPTIDGWKNESVFMEMFGRASGWNAAIAQFKVLNKCR